MKRTTMELGGHAPVMVFDDADVDRRVKLLAPAKYRNAGQVCVSPTRFYIQERVYERFVKGFTERAEALPVGDGLTRATDGTDGQSAPARRHGGADRRRGGSTAPSVRDRRRARSATRATSGSRRCSRTCPSTPGS